MKKIRKGNDIEILWSIYTKNPDGSTTPYVLGGKDLKLSAKISDTRVIEIAFGYGITATNFTPTLNSNKNLSIDVGFVVE